MEITPTKIANQAYIAYFKENKSAPKNASQLLNYSKFHKPPFIGINYRLARDIVSNPPKINVTKKRDNNPYLDSNLIDNFISLKHTNQMIENHKKTPIKSQATTAYDLFKQKKGIFPSNAMQLLSFSESNNLNLKYSQCAEVMSSKNKNKKRLSKIKKKASNYHKRSKSTQLPAASHNIKKKSKRQKKKQEKNHHPVNQNPYEMRNKYVLYVQKHNVKPSITQLKEFCNASCKYYTYGYKSCNDIITLQQSRSIQDIKKTQIIHHSKTFVYIKCIQLEAESNEIEETKRILRPGKQKQDFLVLLLLNGYSRNINKLIPTDIIDCLYDYYGNDNYVWKMIYNAKQSGFERATIICRATYQTLGSSSRNDIATAWYNSERKKYVNENQELLDDWGNKKYFCFYGNEYFIEKLCDDEMVCWRRSDKRWDVDGNRSNSGESGVDICLAKETDEIWFVLARSVPVRYGTGTEGKITKAFVEAWKFWMGCEGL